MPPKDLLNHPTTPCSLEACKLAEPRTVQDGTPAAAAAFASALLARLHVQPRLAQKLAPFRPMVERSVEQSVPPAGSGPHGFTTARLSRALMHASAATGDVRGKRGCVGNLLRWMQCQAQQLQHLLERFLQAQLNCRFLNHPHGCGVLSGVSIDPLSDEVCSDLRPNTPVHALVRCYLGSVYRFPRDP